MAAGGSSNGSSGEELYGGRKSKSKLRKKIRQEEWEKRNKPNKGQKGAKKSSAEALGNERKMLQTGPREAAMEGVVKDQVFDSSVERESLLETIYGDLYDPAEDKDPLPDEKVKDPETLQRLLVKSSNTVLLKALDEKRHIAALKRMELQKYGKNTIVYEQGSHGNSFYMVEEGTFEAFRRPERREGDHGGDLGESVAVYDEENPCFGELALMFPEKRRFTVKTKTGGKLWRIDRATYTRVVVKMAYQQRAHYMQLMNKVKVLKPLAPHELVRLTDAIKLKKFHDGAVILEGGEPVDGEYGIYWVESGAVEIHKENSRQFSTLTPHKYFGETALLLREPKKDDVTAIEDCELAFLGVDAFERLMGKLKTLHKRNVVLFEDICKEVLDDSDPDSVLFR